MSCISKLTRLDEHLIKVKFTNGFETVAVLPSFMLIEGQTEEDYINDAFIADIDSNRQNLDIASGDNALLVSAYAYFQLIIHWQRGDFEPNSDDMDMFEYYKWAMSEASVSGLPKSQKSIRKVYPIEKFRGEHIKGFETRVSEDITPIVVEAEIMKEAIRRIREYDKLSEEYIEAQVNLRIEKFVKKTMVDTAIRYEATIKKLQADNYNLQQLVEQWRNLANH